jgi:hypothetical protein
VCWRDVEYNTGLSGDFVLDIGVFPHFANPLYGAGATMRRIVEILEDPLSVVGLAVGRFETLPHWLDLAKKRRQERVASGKELNFQKAPVGDSANVGRGPFKGRVRGRVEMWQDR